MVGVEDILRLVDPALSKLVILACVHTYLVNEIFVNSTTSKISHSYKYQRQATNQVFRYNQNILRIQSR